MFRSTANLARYMTPSVFLLLLSLGLAPACFAYYQDYLPSGLQSVKALKQKVVVLNFEHDWKGEVLPGITAANCEGQFSVGGADNHGRPWKVEESESRDFGGSCFTADVDGNGRQDVILHFTNASCGYPFSSLVIIFIDEQGMPHRDEIVSRFSVDKNGVSDIVCLPLGRSSRLNRSSRLSPLSPLNSPGLSNSSGRGWSDGKSKGSFVLQQDLAYGKVGLRDCGYWRWSVFRAENSKLVELKSASNVRFPCFVFFSNKPNHLLSSHSANLEQLYRKRP